MWKFITDYCTERNVVLSPRIIHIDFEKAMHNAVLSTFPNTSIMCCRFHLSQNVWKKIQSLGLIGKWLSKFFGLPFLSHVEVENSFVEDTMFDAPNDDKCSKFADYVLENYIMDTSCFPPCMWASVPDRNCSRTNNGPESFRFAEKNRG
jgi:hypothetical protein